MSNPFRIQSAIFLKPDNQDNQQRSLLSSYRPQNLPDLPDLPDLDLYHHRLGFKAYMEQLQEHSPSNSPDPLSLESNHQSSDDNMLLHFINNALSI